MRGKSTNWFHPRGMHVRYEKTHLQSIKQTNSSEKKKYIFMFNYLSSMTQWEPLHLASAATAPLGVPVTTLIFTLTCIYIIKI